MAAYDRNKGVPGLKPNWWISYAVQEVQRVRFGLKTRTVREPGGSSKRAAAALLAQRRREIDDDAWRPPAESKRGTYTFGGLAEEWIALREKSGVKSIRNERQRLRTHAIPVLGEKRIEDVRRQDIRAFIADFMIKPLEATDKPPAPRMVHRVYEDIRGVFAHAVEVLEVLPASPCSLRVKRGELPKKKDADPRWRNTAIYERHEVEWLLSDERIEWPRRVTYAMLFCMGARSGEVVARKWLDYDPTMRPLGRMVVVDTKTESTRLVPVHPLLARMLAEWKLRGFRQFMGRDPTADDYIVPRIRTRGRGRALIQDGRRVWVNMQADLDLLGFRRRRVHDARRTLITLAKADGASKDWLNWITHSPDDDMQSLYTSPPWGTLCEQISCLQLQLRKAEGATVTRLVARTE